MTTSELHNSILKRWGRQSRSGGQDLPGENDRWQLRKAGDRGHPNRSAGIREPVQVDKTSRMLERLLTQSYSGGRAVQRTRLTLLVWTIRARLRENLKRAMDLILCVLALPLFLPVMMIAAVAIKLDSPGPIFFMQERVGKRGRMFLCFKFRSMFVDAEKRKAELVSQNEADEIVFKMKHDPRVTRVGRVIRKLSIDELPQLFNVLRGEMSLVGPRPPVPDEVDHYEYDYCRRLEVMPGLTGLQQVSGRSELSFKRWIELDLQYIQEQSLLKDIEILIRTIPAVLSGKGAY
jgi:exopolysaccharide biosynthesis polyprenyl glycosylphosphotransferase